MSQPSPESRQRGTRVSGALGINRHQREEFNRKWRHRCALRKVRDALFAERLGADRATTDEYLAR